MLAFLEANAATFLVGLALLVVVALIIRVMVRDRRSGKSSCGGNCGGCPSCSVCHGNHAKKIRKFPPVPPFISCQPDACLSRRGHIL